MQQSQWQRPILYGFCAGSIGLLAGVSSLAGGGFFNDISIVTFWIALALLVIVVADVASMIGALLNRADTKPAKASEIWRQPG
jgi:flagellar motor component MotA